MSKPDGLWVVACDSCEGTGVEHADSRSSHYCKVCKGSGHLCSDCGGDGVCSFCEGVESLGCGDCDGTGKCRWCGGKGDVT